MFLLKKKDSKNLPNENETSEKERLFFHDIINHTHGLVLFLGQRAESKKGLSCDEVEDLRKEIKTLQSLLKDQYAFKHKNLSVSYEWVTFGEAYKMIQSILSTYFGQSDVKVTINFSGDLDPSGTAEQKEKGLIYFPVVYRIMNNLIKNMAEAKTKDAEFWFEINHNRFFIQTKNSMGPSQNDMAEFLSRAILDESTPPLEALGLLSVEELARKCGGEFSFEIKDQFWHNRVELPVKLNQIVKKIPA